MKKIVIDARELRTSSGRYIERLLHYLQDIDQEHTYDILLQPKDMEDWQPHNPNFRTVACPHKEFSLGEQWGLFWQIRSLKPDLIHFAFVQQPFLQRSKVVTTMHDLTTARFRNPAKNPIVFILKQQIYKALNRKAARVSKRVFTPTQFVKDDVVRFTGIRPNKVTVTLESADLLSKKATPVSELKGIDFIMYTGRPTPHKNLRRLIEAFAELQKNHPKLHLVLVGKTDSNYASHQQYVAKKGIENVVFTGFVSDPQLRWLYEHTKAYVFPSLSEGFGLPGLEAMLHGAPVVSSNTTCLPEVYGNAALYFNPNDTEDMALKIERVLTDKVLAPQLVARGKEQAKKYSWKRMAAQTLAVYNQVLSGK